MKSGKNQQSWAAAFQSIQEAELVQRYGHIWKLQIKKDITDELTDSERQEGWKIYQSASFGRFKCFACQHVWNSARVSLTFQYRRIGLTGGEVYLRLYRQQCRNCQSNILLTAKCEESDMREVLMRLTTKIRKNCYKENTETRTYEKNVKNTKPHEESLCEACMLGKCKRDAEFN
ncbi:receptor-transporting protein 3-like [Rhinophrynus dorsalis]